MGYRLGIDAGSKTVKLVCVDDAGKIVFCYYRRHKSNIKDTLVRLLRHAARKDWNASGPVCVTGSAGIQIAEMLDVPFVQEVEACECAVDFYVPQADVVIELGGEDAKIVYRGVRPEERMNATCAGGTGSFIDTISYMLGLSAKEMCDMAGEAERIYPIASRCAVFAQSDVRPLLNAGASKADLSASVFQSVVNQVVGGLACGRPIEGNIVFLGGPCEYLPALVDRFRSTLGLTEETGIKPDFAHFYVALGAALSAESEHTYSLKELADAVEQREVESDELETLPPLFASKEEETAFKERHGNGLPNITAKPQAQAKSAKPTLQAHIDAVNEAYKRTGSNMLPAWKMVKTSQWEGKDLYLGIDAGSTAVKFVLVNDEGKIVRSGYELLAGDLLRTVNTMFRKVFAGLPHDKNGDLTVNIRHVCVTGYGEELLKAALRVDSSVVETVAHLKAAQAVAPGVSFVLDIGGQDIKAMWVKNGRIDNVVINEACSSGCGSLIEGFAHTLGQSLLSFSKAALEARNPVDLGIRCSVFMTSRVRHAQKLGIGVDDISAGLAYSVVKNALFKVVGMKSLDTLGDTVVVQGGTFMSDAVLRAFELISGKHVTRPSIAGIMGAFGAALVALERKEARSTSLMIKTSKVKLLAPQQRAMTCTGCPNACLLTVSVFKDEYGGVDRVCVSGNRCETGIKVAGGTNQGGRAKGPNSYRAQQALMQRLFVGDSEHVNSAPRGKIGLPTTLLMYSAAPFWKAFFTRLGFQVVFPGTPDRLHRRIGMASISSESVCYCAKETNMQVASLLQQGVDALFLPVFDRQGRCPVASEYNKVVSLNTRELHGGPVVFDPKLLNHQPALMAGCDGDVSTLARQLGVATEDVSEAIDCGLKVLEEFKAKVDKATQRALDWATSQGESVIVLAGRPYHNDEKISHGIDEVLAGLGYAVVGQESLLRLNPPSGSAWRSTSDAWEAVGELEQCARLVAADSKLELVQLYSFGCTVDALESYRVHDIIEGAKKYYTALKIDEMVDLAHVRIRLRTLDEALRMKKASGEDHLLEESACERDAAEHEFEDVRGLQKMNAEDVNLGLGLLDGDICYPMTAIAGKAASTRSRKGSAGTKLQCPPICLDCLMEHLPGALQDALRSTGEAASLSFDGNVETYAALVGETGELTANVDENAPKVGILGNPLFSFDTYMNRDLARIIVQEGCIPVLPSPKLLECGVITYLEQLREFAKQGVRDVIYVQAFGCLKGHVDVRGALRMLESEFPELSITVIDYDSGTSYVNQLNRAKLALSSAKKRARN